MSLKLQASSEEGQGGIPIRRRVISQGQCYILEVAENESQYHIRL